MCDDNERRIITPVECPKCGRQFRKMMKEGFQVIVCDLEEAGCDSSFAVDIKFVSVSKSYKLIPYND